MNTLGDWDGHIPTFAVQSLSCVRLLVIPWTAAHQAPLSSTISCSLLKLMSIKSVMLSNPLCCPLLLLPTNFPSIRVFFQWVSTLHHVTRVLELQLQHQSFQWILRVDSLSDGLVGFPCSPRDSPESSPAPQFKSISSSAFSFLYDQTPTSLWFFQWSYVDVKVGPYTHL